MVEPQTDQIARDQINRLESIVMRHIDVSTNEREHIRSQREAEDRWKNKIESLVNTLGDKVDAIPIIVQTAINETLKERIKSAVNQRIKNISLAANAGLGSAVIWLFGHIMKWW